jgi:hypothetical protein
MTSNTAIATFLIIAAVCQIIGTTTVAINYYRTGEIAKNIIGGSELSLASVHWERRKLAALAGKLTRRWWLTLGLAAYVVGAIAGLTGGLIWLYR